jgi:hypothetical protein
MLNIPWIREYWFLNIVDMKNPIFVMGGRSAIENVDLPGSVSLEHGPSCQLYT